MRKRNKIKLKLPTHSASDDNNDNDNDLQSITRPSSQIRPKQNLKISILNEEDDQLDMGLLELDVKLKNRTKKHPTLVALQNHEDDGDDNEDQKGHDYTDLFVISKEPKHVQEKIINLEGISDVDDGDESELKEKVQEMRRHKIVMDQKYRTSHTGFYDHAEKSLEYDEKAYVRLLDSDDKEQLNEILGKRRTNTPPGKYAQEFDDDAAAATMVEDEKLALTKSEAIDQTLRRKKEIEAALNHHDDEGDEWETTQLNKFDKTTNSTLKRQLPRRFKAQAEDIHTIEEMLQTLLPSNASIRISLLQKQLDLVQAELAALNIRKVDLLNKVKTSVVDENFA
ncbi:Ntr2p Ecym_6339 [Eremothecium cymbalariae DBVPG|uniref:Uncharacterized protein n=1 Tax=Eremothecium cymbalariae (strain CBS 270.75 / DBVPG 7215 / KCTC 17166 / NRRL Y-17582) TaxID=931890 RepID=G8JUD5_ERECY|nr:hypothetical protein Ecym_6339 [Eremothecium cymbalariae DBVPG\